jgi:hypothetical protein
MTPKEKSEELFMMYVDKGMNQINPVINRVVRKEMAKQCALIAVDEIVTELEKWCELDDYWQEVKTEIQNL